MSGRYDQLYTYVMFGMVLSYTMTVIGLFILRWKRPDIPRPYRCTGYPWLPAIYVLIGGAWTLNTIVTRPTEAFWGTAHCADRRAGILVLEADEQKSRSKFLMTDHIGVMLGTSVVEASARIGTTMGEMRIARARSFASPG